MKDVLIEMTKFPVATTKVGLNLILKRANAIIVYKFLGNVNGT